MQQQPAYNRPVEVEEAILAILHESGPDGIPTMVLRDLVVAQLKTTPGRMTDEFLWRLRQMEGANTIRRLRIGQTILCALVGPADACKRTASAGPTPQPPPPPPIIAPGLQDVAATLRHLSSACLSVSEAADRISQTCEEGMDMSWREKIEAYLLLIVERLVRIEEHVRTSHKDA